MSTLLGVLLIVGVVALIVWQSFALVKDIQARKSRKNKKVTEGSRTSETEKIKKGD